MSLKTGVRELGPLYVGLVACARTDWGWRDGTLDTDLKIVLSLRSVMDMIRVGII